MRFLKSGLFFCLFLFVQAEESPANKPPSAVKARLGALKVEIGAHQALIRQGLYFTIETIPQNLVQKIDDQGKADFIAILPKRLTMYLENADQKKLWQGKIEIPRKETPVLRLNFSENPSSPVTSYTILRKDLGYRRTWFHGWQKSEYLDGREEYFHEGMVFGRQKGDQTSYYRFDADNDGLDDKEDEDDDNDLILDKRDEDDDNDNLPDLKDLSDTDDDNNGVLNQKEPDALIAGHFFRPFITEITVVPLLKSGRFQVADLLLITARVETAFGRQIKQVNLRIQSEAKELDTLLYDDGSLRDLVDRQPGRQISGDMQEGDHLYTVLIPLTQRISPILSGAALEIQAQNSLGLKSNIYTFYLPEIKTEDVKEGPSDLLRQIQSLSLVQNGPGEKRGLTMHLSSQEPLEINRIWQNVRTRISETNTLKLPSYSDTMSNPVGSPCIYTVSDSDGSLFYFGEHF